MIGCTTGHIRCGRDQRGHVDQRFQRGDRLHRTNHSRSPCHIPFHLVHAISWLERDTTGIKGDTFPNKSHPLIRAICRAPIA